MEIDAMMLCVKSLRIYLFPTINLRGVERREIAAVAGKYHDILE
jgi:hypothetical protein